MDSIRDVFENFDEITENIEDGEDGIRNIISAIREYRNRTSAAEGTTISFGSVIKKIFSSKLAMTGIVFGIGLISNYIDKLINYKEKIKETAEEARKEIEKIDDEFNSKKESINNLKARYSELSQGVNSKTKKNISLSTDEYEEFLLISNKLVEIFPQLYSGLSDSGTALTNLSGDVDTIVDALDNLVQKQREISNFQILEELPKVFDGINVEIEEIDDKIEDLEIKRDSEISDAIYEIIDNDRYILKIDDNLNYMQDENGNLVLNKYFESYSEDVENLKQKLEELGITYQTTATEINGMPYIKFDFDDKALFELDEKLKEANIQSSVIAYSYDQKIYSAELEKKNLYAKINPITQAWVRGNFLYNEIEEPLQDIVEKMVNGIDFSTAGIDSQEKMEKYITDNILTPLYNSSPEVKNAFANLVNIKEQFQNGVISQEDFRKQVVKMFNDLINGMSPDDIVDFKPLFIQGLNKSGIEGSDFDTVIKNLIESWNIEIKEKNLSFNFFGSSYQKAVEEYKSDLKSLSDWQTEYITNGFLSDDTIYDLKAKFKGIFDFSEFDKNNNYNQMFDGLLKAIKDKMLEPLNEMLNDKALSEGMKNSIQSAIYMIENIADSTMESINSLKAYSSAIDNIQNAYNTVSNAVSEYQSNQYLSLDTVQSLLELDEKYLRILFNENGQLILNKNSYKELVKAELTEMSVKLQNNAIDSISKIKSEEYAINQLKNKIIDATEANWDYVSSEIAKARALLDTEDIINGNTSGTENRRKLLDQIELDYNNRAKLLKNVFNNINKNIDGMMSNTSSDTAKTINLIDWAENSISNLSNTISKLNEKLNNNTLTYKERKKVIDDLILSQNKLVKLSDKNHSIKLYNNQYNTKLNDLGKNKNKYKSLIESRQIIDIETFNGNEKLYDKIKDAQNAWNTYQNALNKYQEEVEKYKELLKQRYEDKIEIYDSRISRLNNSNQIKENEITLKKTKGLYVEESDYQYMIQNKNIILSETKGKLHSILEERKNENKTSERYKELTQEAQNVKSEIIQIKNEQIELNREMLKLPIQKLEKEKEILEKQLELISKKEENLNDAISYAGNYIESQIDSYNELKEAASNMYDAQINQWQEKIDLLNKTNDEIKQQIELEKAQYEFEKSTQNKNVKIYREGIGFVYEADQDAVRSSKETLEQLQFDKKIKDYEKEISLIEEQKEKELESIETRIELLNDYKDLLDSISNKYEDILGLQKLMNEFGVDSLDRINNGDISLITEMTNRYINIQTDKSNTDSKISSIENSIEEINSIADAWNGNITKITNAKSKIERIVTNNTNETNSIKKTNDTIKSIAKQWSKNELSIKDSLGLINTDHIYAKEEEKEILDERLKNLKYFSEQARNYLSSAISSLNEAKIKEAELNTTKQNIIKIETEIKSNNSNNTNSKNSKNKNPNKYKKHSGMKTGYVGENLSSSDKDNFRYVALNEMKPDEVPAILQLGESVLTQGQQYNIMHNMKSAFVMGTQTPSIQKMNIPSSNTISFNGDIIIEKLNGDVNEFAKKVKSEFLLRLEQELYT